MKRIPSSALAFFALNCIPVSAANLMLDFGPNAVDESYYTLSPGHHTNAISTEETAWNMISSAGTTSVLGYSDGTAASGVSLSVGQESTAGNNTINFSSTGLNVTLAGTGGGTANQQRLYTTNSIYGSTALTDPVSTSTPGRDGFLGATGSAIGIRLDGLAAGTYLIYVMARNTNSNVASSPMNVYAASGANAGTFNFSGLSAFSQSNIGYATAAYTNQYTQFVNGENYVALNVTVGSGDSLFLAVDGSPTGETRGFLNMVQIVAVPEPVSALLGAVGLLFGLRRKR